MEPSLPELDLAQFRELNRVRVKNLYTTMRALYDAVAGPGKFLIAATRLGGLHGYGPVSAAAPLGGSVTGFTKAYRIEQRMREAGAPLVKAVDFEVSRKTAEPADLLLAETLADPGVVEAGYCDGLRYGVTLTEQPARDGEPGMTLDERTVFVITGAAGGITSALVADLAVASRGTFYLLDLVDAPAADDPYVQSLRAGEDALKQKLIHEARAAGERPTPAAINRRIMEIERREAALRAVEAVTAAAEPRSIAASICSTGTPCPPWSTRFGSVTAASTCCCTPAGCLSTARCPKRSRRSSTWSLTSRPTAFSTC